jgi:hypothetical protein
MSRSWLRRTAAGAGIGLLLTSVGALTGLGSGSANAVDFSLTAGRVTAQLSHIETDMSADGRDGASLICTFDVVPMASSYVTIPQETCIHALVSCGTAARKAGLKALVTFYQDRQTCQGV